MSMMEPATASGVGTHRLDIGRPTMRGVRKCPKCGIYNGTRGFSCKNKSCGMVFRTANEIKKSLVAGDACKLYTGTEMPIYSVRLSKDKGPDYRGFVLLPMVEGMEAGSELEGEAALLVQSASRCYVEQCPRAQLKDIVEVNLGEGCSHIRSCLSSLITISSPVILRHSAMNDLEIRSEFKHDVYSFAETCSGPLVQRVNKQVFVVQCEVDGKHPLGYLHLAFIEQKVREKPGSEQRFFCTCDTFRGVNSSGIRPLYYTQWSPELRSRQPDWILRRCIHYYACLCAFASDKKLKDEFKHYLELDSMLVNLDRLDNQETLQQQMQVEVLDNMKDSIGILDLYSSSQQGEQIQIRVETSEGLQTITVPGTVSGTIPGTVPVSLSGPGVPVSMSSGLPVSLSGGLPPVSLPGGMPVSISSGSVSASTGIKLAPVKLEAAVAASQQIANALSSLNSSNPSPSGGGGGGKQSMGMEVGWMTGVGGGGGGGTKRKSSSSIQLEGSSPVKTAAALPPPPCMSKSHESGGSQQACLGFQTWLSSITEKINQTMHFQFTPNPDPLVFTAPHAFFDILRDRISLGGKKKRLPNNVVAFVRRDSLPTGTFTKYTWNITSLRHVQQIFDTPQVSLAVVKTFVCHKDGSFTSAPVSPFNQAEDKFSKLPGKLRIKAHELKTFLRVGSTSLEPEGTSTFDIEWIPDVLPVTSMGELRIRFCFGHSRNGVLNT